MLNINPTAEAPTTDQRIAQLIRQFNGIAGNLTAIIANGLPAQAQVVNPQGAVVRPALDAVSASDVTASLDRVIGQTSRLAVVNALAVLSGAATIAPTAATTTA